jgi:hypothetical protein
MIFPFVYKNGGGGDFAPVSGCEKGGWDAVFSSKQALFFLFEGGGRSES